MTTKAQYLSYPFAEFQGDLQEVTADLPQPTGTQVLVRVNYCGVCHSDVHLHEGFYNLGQGKKLMLEDRGIKLPVTLGHEIVGEIVAAGDQAGQYATGPVLVYPWVGCGSCSVCQRGEENLCTQPAALGVYKPGGYAQYVVVPHPRYVMSIGDIDPVHAPLLACSGLTTWSAIKKVGAIYDDEAVVVFGCGGLGLLAIRTLALKGVKNIIALDLDADKRQLALDVGATQVFDPTMADATQQIQAAANNKCVAVLDFVGAESTVELGISLPRRGGKVILVGLHGGEIRYPIPYVITRAISIIGSYTGSLPEQKELVEFAQKNNLFNFPIRTRPLKEANSALQELAQGKVQGRLVLDNR
ncbi:MAG: alcohol dehydrogenase catalytic domain-containing protein [Alcaligenaceae bacterium]|nr:alcohol dehydrogenase catalytic domain-containing protein [Alcaligenaceae bacterium]